MFVLHVPCEIVLINISFSGVPYVNSSDEMLWMPDDFPVLSGRIPSVTFWCQTTASPVSLIPCVVILIILLLGCLWQLNNSSQYIDHLLSAADVSVSKDIFLSVIKYILCCCGFVNFLIVKAVLLLPLDYPGKPIFTRQISRLNSINRKITPNYTTAMKTKLILRF